MEDNPVVPAEPPNTSRELQLLRLLVRDLDEAMVVVDVGRRVVRVNRRAEHLTGLCEAEVVGKPCHEVLACEHCGTRGELLDAASDPEVDTCDWTTPSGNELRLQVTRRALRDDAGRVVGIAEILRQVEPSEMPRRSRPSWVEDPADAAPLRAIVGRSAAIRQVVDMIRRVARTEVPVLVTGESGTGKELVARALHALSARRGRPFVAINCAALPAELIESELFGHVRGAFTGAVRDRLGAVEAAHGGTFVLDEIGDLDPALQVKLLRLLQERTFRRVGETQERAADLRVVAATNVDLERAVAQGRFRSDLYYRLRVVPIRIPPLRERREDVHPLASSLLARRSVAAGRLPMRFSPEAMRVLESYSWPGNVRELVNAVDYVVALCREDTVGSRDLPEDLHEPRSGARSVLRGRYRPPVEGDDGEPERILQMLQAHGYHRQRTADALGMDRVTLYRKMKSYGIEGAE